VAGDIQTGRGFQRDPVSVLFDSGARRLLARAYADPGNWAATRLAEPEARHVAHFAGMGINVLGPDNAATVSGRHYDARSRWARAMIRSLHYVNRDELEGWPLQVRVGRRLRRLGIIPAGREIEARVFPSRGRGARRAVAALRPSERIFDPAGNPGPRQADPDGRDW
jgi:hypothetical protein